MFDQHTIPRHISQLIDELGQCIQSATAPGVSDASADGYASVEDRLTSQLRALGWGAVLADSGRWMAVPAGYTIVHNPPDPTFSPQRRYPVPEAPDRWLPIWEEGSEVCFPAWGEAYAYVFTHWAREQALLPIKRFRVRPATTYGGDDYAAATADLALHLHLNTWLSRGALTVPQVLTVDLVVFEHGRGDGFYCQACQHAPCTYTPPSGWTLPPAAGWIGSSF
jgi:hypothetical protein